MKHAKRIVFTSWDGDTKVKLGHGKDCVLVQVDGLSYAGAVLDADEAEHLGWNLIRQARYSRETREAA